MSADELRTPTEWADALGIHILDPDGWRGPNGRPFDEPISADEFDRRVFSCTVKSDWSKPFPKARHLTIGGAS